MKGILFGAAKAVADRIEPAYDDIPNKIHSYTRALSRDISKGGISVTNDDAVWLLENMLDDFMYTDEIPFREREDFRLSSYVTHTVDSAIEALLDRPLDDPCAVIFELAVKLHVFSKMAKGSKAKEMFSICADTADVMLEALIEEQANILLKE